MLILSWFFQGFGDHRDLHVLTHSFPTRRSSDLAEAAERAGLALVHRMEALVAAIPELEDRATRMSAQRMDNGHALAERIDMLEARLHALGELSDDTRSRTLSASTSRSEEGRVGKKGVRKCLFWWEPLHLTTNKQVPQRKV